MTYPFISRTWFRSNLSICIPNQPNTDGTEWLHHMITSKDDHNIIQIAAIIYQIWYARNTMIFEDRFVLENEIIRQATISIQEYTHANLLPSSSQQHDASGIHLFNQHRCSTRNHSDSHLPPRRWIKPNPNFLKANNDASLRDLGLWALGAIIRDDQGLAMATTTWQIDGFDDAASTEAFSILKTMQLALDCGFLRVIFEYDNQTVIKLLKKEIRNNMTYVGKMVNEMLTMKTSFDCCLFSFKHRDCNRVAHHMAQLTLTEPNRVWLEDIP